MNRPPLYITSTALLIALALGLASCAGDPQYKRKNSTSSSTTDQSSLAATITGTRVSFRYSDYYSLSYPNANNCAGDAKNYYDPLAIVLPSSQDEASRGLGTSGLEVTVGTTGTRGALKLPESETISGETIKPSFIKNISVDLTNSNAPIAQNAAYSCSYTNSSSLPSSNCATFDYGAVGGIPTSLGGTTLIIGGTQAATLYGLGVNTMSPSDFTSDPNLMPAYNGTSGPSGSVSAWQKLSSATSYTGPASVEGGSASYNDGTQSVLLFGGVS